MNQTEVYLCLAACALALGALIAAETAAVRIRREADYMARLLEESHKMLSQENQLDRQSAAKSLARTDAAMRDLREDTRAAMADGFRQTDARLTATASQSAAAMSAQREEIRRTLAEGFQQTENRLSASSADTLAQLSSIRSTVETQLASVREDNNRRLDEMRQIVDEKLQKTLNDRMTQSFSLVNQRLEQVYRAMGEMQTLAQGVGDLKKVLTNVKSRGILGEVQLGAILSEILAPEQYETNVRVKPGSTLAVEFAVKLPTEDGFVYMPIDSKFPGDTYQALADAYDSGEKEQVDAAAAQLMAIVRQEARSIHEKYIAPPHTTDFAVMFLPFEGLYAEVVNRGMVEKLQREFRVNIAGPSTMAALLNSLQMGFRSVALQKQSDEVRKVLFSVRSEFDKFADALYKTQDRINRAGEELDTLVGARTRMMRKQLHQVDSLTRYEGGEDMP